ncbi:consortin, connexin sorting protein b isoform X2 [Synchiropus splendidus]|uniref:consortin, connexin sorting protein b isoform X2 n=1 Tax=Synchiropus splendidus TaxID=270530 RepID=UPI00237D39F0|nr:consortin, connexin sorting protein b isoform X2 [Synchiropus splendidus]
MIRGSVSADGWTSLGPELLASLQALGENTDYTLLPQSLHQMAEACSLQEDYQMAIKFLQLEKLYHERLLFNLSALQETWESETRERTSDNSLSHDADASQEHIEALSRICRTHHLPCINVQWKTLDAIQRNAETLQPFHETGLQDEGQEVNDEGETYEEGHEVGEEEVCEETPEEEDVKVEWPTGVPQASEKDLAKLSTAEGSSSPDGLVSILKRRRASLDGLPPPSTIVKQNSKRKVRFSEPDDCTEHFTDEVGGDSCLILLLLCIITVIISVGGTALYCTLVDTYSNICTDFTHNIDFFVSSIGRFFEGLGRLLPFRT